MSRYNPNQFDPHTVAVYGAPSPPKNWSPRFGPIVPEAPPLADISKLLMQQMGLESLTRVVLDAYARCNEKDVSEYCVSFRVAGDGVEASIRWASNGHALVPQDGTAARGANMPEALTALAQRVLDRYAPLVEAITGLREKLSAKEEPPSKEAP